MVLSFHEDWRKPVASVVVRKVSCPFCLSEEEHARSIIRPNGRQNFSRAIPSLPPNSQIFPPSEKGRGRILFFHQTYTFEFRFIGRMYEIPVSISISMANGLTWRKRRKGGGEFERKYGSRGRGRASLFRLVRTASLHSSAFVKKKPSVRHAFRILQTIITCAHVAKNLGEDWEIRSLLVIEKTMRMIV